MISFLGNSVNAKYEKLAYDFEFKDLGGGPLNLSDYKGKIIVVVNVDLSPVITLIFPNFFSII